MTTPRPPDTWQPFQPAVFLDRLRDACEAELRFPKGVEQLVRLLHRCSLFRDEDRAPTLICVLRADDGGPAPLTPLQEPIDVTDRPELLAQLSFATGREISALYFEAGADDRLLLLGISAIPSLSPLDELDPERYHFSVLGPAHLTLANVLATVEYKRGKYTDTNRAARLSECWPRAAVQRLVGLVAEPAEGGTELGPGLGLGRTLEAIDPQQWELHGESFLEAARQSAPWALAAMGEGLLAEVRRLGRGGAILIHDSESPLRNLVRAALSFRQPDGRTGKAAWSTGLVARLAHDLHVGFAMGSHGHAPRAVLSLLVERGSVETLSEWARGAGAARLQAAERQQADATRALSLLTQIDGALVCDGHLEPLAAGAILEVPQRSLLPVSLRGRGTRHQSMWATASANPGSLGIVVSQDGDITVFRGSKDPRPLLVH